MVRRTPSCLLGIAIPLLTVSRMVGRSADRLMLVFQSRSSSRLLRSLQLASALLLLTGLAAGNAAAAAELPSGLSAEQRLQRQRFVGVWALVDNDNNLFNVRLSPGGRALSTSGVVGTAFGGSENLRPGQLFEQGLWRPWGNGVRVDYADGWTDAIVTGPPAEFGG